MSLFFFYQADIESLLSTHDFGFYQYQQFKNYLDHSNKNPSQESILKPVFGERKQFLEYDLLNTFSGSLYLIEEMKLKDPVILGKLANQIASKLVGEENFNDKQCIFDISNKSQVKEQLLENITIILNQHGGQ
jgi:hypothetical protein